MSKVVRRMVVSSIIGAIAIGTGALPASACPLPVPIANGVIITVTNIVTGHATALVDTAECEAGTATSGC